MPAWNILIPTIPHRHHRLLGLLAALDAQISPGSGVTVRVLRDNLGLSIGAKRQALLDASDAAYVSWVDDDDLVAPDYVESVRAALAAGPDIVGFAVLFTVDGSLPKVTWHALGRPGWDDGPRPWRDVSHLCPIRRELALLGTWEGGYGEDRRWADAVRASGQVRTGALIDRWMYWYRFSSGDCSLTPRQPWEGLLPGLPGYPWLTVTETVAA